MFPLLLFVSVHSNLSCLTNVWVVSTMDYEDEKKENVQYKIRAIKAIMSAEEFQRKCF